MVSSSVITQSLTAPGFWGNAGASGGFFLSVMGSAFATGKTSLGFMIAGLAAPENMVKNLLPIVMAGILGIYGLIIAIMSMSAMDADFGPFEGYALFASGMCVGGASLSSGYAIGIVGDNALRAIAIEEDLYVPAILIMIFSNAPALYGLLCSILLLSKKAAPDMTQEGMDASFWGLSGMALSMALSGMGAAYGTAKSGLGLMYTGQIRPEIVWRNMIPVIMAGVNAIYGLIVAVLINTQIGEGKDYDYFKGWAHFTAGITVGLSALASGMCIGVVGDIGVRSNAQQEQMYVPMVLVLIYGGALGLFGLIVAIQLVNTG